MSTSTDNQALTHQAPSMRARLDRARNLLQKRDRRIAQLETQVTTLTAQRDAARRELATCLTTGRLRQSEDRP